MRVAITGTGGQLGRELLRASWGRDVEVVGYDRARLDIAQEEQVIRVIGDLRPDVIVNAAAYTGVDTAEEEKARAYRVNAEAVGLLAESADRVGALLFHISTDYVFDGTKAGWYNETDGRSPLGVYGASKAAGEDACLAYERGVVLRTSWVYGALGSNFVTTMLRLARERDVLGVVFDQIGCPTAAKDVAGAVTRMVDVSNGSIEGVPQSLYHVASPDEASWHDVAMATFEASHHGFAGECKRLTTAEYPTRAERPANSRLATDRIASDFGIRLPGWRTSLAEVVRELETA